jgi:L-rhamnose mutarotase
LFVEFHGKQVSYEKILEQIYAELETKIEMFKVKSLKIYYKPEENKVYCVVNENETYTIEI